MGLWWGSAPGRPSGWGILLEPRTLHFYPGREKGAASVSPGACSSCSKGRAQIPWGTVPSLPPLLRLSWRENCNGEGGVAPWSQKGLPLGGAEIGSPSLSGLAWESPCGNPLAVALRSPPGYKCHKTTPSPPHGGSLAWPGAKGLQKAGGAGLQGGSWGRSRAGRPSEAALHSCTVEQAGNLNWFLLLGGDFVPLKMETSARKLLHLLAVGLAKFGCSKWRPKDTRRPRPPCVPFQGYNLTVGYFLTVRFARQGQLLPCWWPSWTQEAKKEKRKAKNFSPLSGRETLRLPNGQSALPSCGPSCSTGGQKTGGWGGLIPL